MRGEEGKSDSLSFSLPREFRNAYSPYYYFKYPTLDPSVSNEVDKGPVENDVVRHRRDVACSPTRNRYRIGDGALRIGLTDRYFLFFSVQAGIFRISFGI